MLSKYALNAFVDSQALKVDSLGLLFMNKVGGHMYDDTRKDGPFLITVALLSVVLIGLVILAIMGKLKV